MQHSLKLDTQPKLADSAAKQSELPGGTVNDGGTTNGELEKAAIEYQDYTEMLQKQIDEGLRSTQGGNNTFHQ